MTETSAAEAAKRVQAFLDATTDAVPAVRPEVSIADLRTLLAEREQLRAEVTRLIDGLLPHPTINNDALVAMANDKRADAERDRDGWREECLRRREMSIAETAAKEAAVAAREQAEAELTQMRENVGEIGEEWGLRVTYTNGTTFEGPCAATELEARCIIAELDSELNRNDVASRILLVRTITGGGRWRDADPEATGA